MTSQGIASEFSKHAGAPLSAKPAGQRLRALDALRGIAAIAVVIYHFGFRVAEIYPVGDPLDGLSAGQYGVHLFFVISGFVIFLSLRRATPRSFIISRFIRLYPIYWVCALLTFSSVYLLGLPGRAVSVPDAAINATMLQAYLGVPHIDGAYWTLSAEIGFYLQVAILFFCGLLSGRRLAPTLYIWLLVALVASQAHKYLPQDAFSESVARLSAGLVWVPFFVAGIALYQVWSGERDRRILALPAVVVGLIALRDLSLGLATIGVLVIFVMALWVGTRWRVPRILVVLGEISFPLYLIHQNVGYIAIRWLTAAGIDLWLAALVALAVVIVIAFVLTYYVDQPLRRLLWRAVNLSRDSGGMQKKDRGV